MNNMMLTFTVCIFGVVLGSFSVFADGPPPSCCLKLGDLKLPLEKVLNYRIQTEGLCPINAVVIETVSGKRLCSDPNSNWTKRAMGKVDEKKKPGEQEPVSAHLASVEGSRGQVDPVTATKLPLNRRWNGVFRTQKTKKEKLKTTTKAHKGPKGKKSKRSGVKGKNKKCEDKEC